MAKLLLPETEQPQTLGKHVLPAPVEERSLMEAVINGAMAGVKLLVGIAALLLAMVSLLALINLFLGWLGGFFGWNWSLEHLLGYVFYPFALLTGIPPSDALWAGTLLGKRMILTEFPVYQELGAMMTDAVAGVFYSGQEIIISLPL